MTNSGEEQDRFKFTHTHKWSLQRDEEFSEEGQRLLTYMVAAQENIPCVHQDHPAIAAVETMVGGMTRGLPIQMGQAMEVLAHVFFAAGQQYAADGHYSSAHPSFEPQKDLSAPGQSMEDWTKMHRDSVREWRENIREQFYRPREETTLADLLKHLAEHHGELNITELPPEEVVKRLLGPQPQSSQDEEQGHGLYL
jgi:hypothetical protein